MQKTFVIDASVVIAWCFQDEACKYADTVLESMHASSALVPAIWPLEIANVLIVAERKKRLRMVDSMRFLELLDSLPITVEKEHPGKIWREILTLAREQHLSSYDAAYLDLAIRRELPLATLDKVLVGAARRCGVALLK